MNQIVIVRQVSNRDSKAYVKIGSCFKLVHACASKLKIFPGHAANVRQFKMMVPSCD